MQIETPRLILRDWRDSDRAPFEAMSKDPVIMEFLRPLPTRAESDAWIDRQRQHQAACGYCFWAVERRSDGLFLGSVGLVDVPYQASFTPAVELGWRLDRPFWGQGYAMEAAEASVRFGFETLRRQELVAVASAGNGRSRRVMERLRMVTDPADDFDHPMAEAGAAHRRCVLYRRHA